VVLRLLLAFSCGLCAACSSPPRLLEPRDGEPAPTLADARFEYRVGTGDVLRINVFAHPELSSGPYEGGVSGTPVDGKGEVMLPLLGDVPVEGMTVTEVAQRVEERLSTYMLRPRVDVAVVRFGSLRVLVLGEVGRPGAVALARPGGPYEAIGLAGGFTRYANRDHVAWFRGALVEENLRLFDASQIDPAAFEHVQSGDVIFVSRRSWADRAEAAVDLLPLLSVVTQPLSLALQWATFERLK